MKPGPRPWPGRCLLLALYPEAQDRVAAEAAGGVPDFAALSRLRFTRDVFREALRLYPPVPMMVRETARPEEFRGRQVAQGAQVVLSPWHLHRHERLWDRPDEFDPDRWQTEAGALRRATAICRSQPGRASARRWVCDDRRGDDAGGIWSGGSGLCGRNRAAAGAGGASDRALAGGDSVASRAPLGRITGPEISQYVQSNSGCETQIAAFFVDLGGQTVDRFTLFCCNAAKCVPELGFQRDAGSVTI